MFKRLSYFVLALLLLSLTTAVTHAQSEINCYDAQGASIEIMGLWTTDQFNAVVSPLVNQCNLSINYTQVESSDLLQRINTGLAAGSPPDISQMPDLYSMAQFADDGNLVSLDKLGVNGSNYVPNWKYYGSEDSGSGAVWYSLPLQATIISLLWYKPDLFKSQGFSVPQTYQDFTTLLDAMNKTSIKPLSMGFQNWAFTAAGFTHDIMITNSGPAFTENLARRESRWTDGVAIDAWNTYLTWIKNYDYNAQPLTVQGDEAILIPFRDDKAYMVKQADFAGSILQSNGYTYGTDFNYFPFPSGGTLQVSAGYIAAFSDKPGVAAAIAYLSSTDGANSWAANNLGLSANSTVSPDAYSNSLYADLAKTLAGASDITFDISGLVSSDLRNQEYDLVTRFVSGELSADSALSNLDEQYQAALNKQSSSTQTLTFASTNLDQLSMRTSSPDTFMSSFWHRTCRFNYKYGYTCG